VNKSAPNDWPKTPTHKRPHTSVCEQRVNKSAPNSRVFILIDLERLDPPTRLLQGIREDQRRVIDEREFVQLDHLFRGCRDWRSFIGPVIEEDQLKVEGELDASNAGCRKL